MATQDRLRRPRQGHDGGRSGAHEEGSQGVTDVCSCHVDAFSCGIFLCCKLLCYVLFSKLFLPLPALNNCLCSTGLESILDAVSKDTEDTAPSCICNLP